MKMILRISPSRQKAWRVLEHVYGQGDYKAERSITNRVGQPTYQFEAGVPSLDPKFDAQLLLARHHGKGKEVRHLIFSAEEMPLASASAYQLALNAMVAAAVDFAATQAPGHDFIIVPHSDRLHPHCHMVLCASNGQRCIDWKPKDLIRFQGLDFLSDATRQQFSLAPGRGAGKRPPGVGRVAYDHAVTGDLHKPVERRKAEQFDFDKIMEGIAKGTIEVARRNKKSEATSVLLDGKRIRISTLRRAHSDKPKKGKNNEAHASPKPAPVHARQRLRHRNRAPLHGI